jgi:hypothetical protein
MQYTFQAGHAGSIPVARSNGSRSGSDLFEDDARRYTAHTEAAGRPEA